MAKTAIGQKVDPQDVQPQGDGSGLDADSVDGYAGHAPTKAAHDALNIDSDTVDGKHASDLGGAGTVNKTGQVSVASGAFAWLSATQTGPAWLATHLYAIDGSEEGNVKVRLTGDNAVYEWGLENNHGSAAVDVEYAEVQFA